MSLATFSIRCLVALGIFAGGSHAQDVGRGKLAEIIAFVRLASEACEGSVPDVWGFEALSLVAVVKPPITEDEIQIKEKEVEQLRVRLGRSKWCQLYVTEMAEAHSIFDLARKGTLR